MEPHLQTEISSSSDFLSDPPICVLVIITREHATPEKLMAHREIFRGFFSYSHFDAIVDPQAIESFSKDLESRISSRLVNAHFEIWIDRERLKTGYRWDKLILESINNSDVFIVILTPKWIESDYCRKELDRFLEVEKTFEVGEYIAPIMARSLEGQVRHFNPEQKLSFSRLTERQYKKLLFRDFLKLNPDERSSLIEEIADDIEGMIEWRRSIRNNGGSPPPRSNPNKPLPTEFDARAHNFEIVDFLTEGEVVIERSDGENPRAIFAHIGFIPRMYVQSKTVRVEFGIQRAFLSLDTEAENPIMKSNDIREGQLHRNAYYVSWRPSPTALTLCIDPSPGSNTLQEIPLMPAPNENRLAKIAEAPHDLDYTKVNAVLSVSLSAEGLFIFGEQDQKPSAAQVKKISAIASIALSKEEKLRLGYIEKVIPVSEKNK